jgi:hypothetical protein
MSPIGPQIPPHLLKSRKEEKEEDDIEDIDKRKSSSNTHNNKYDNDEDDDDDDDDAPYGPSLPPDLRKSQIGPTLPPSLSNEYSNSSSSSSSSGSSSSSKRSYGPTLPPTNVSSTYEQAKYDDDEEEDDEFVGPAIPKDLGKEKDADYEFQQKLVEIEQRAQRDQAREEEEERLREEAKKANQPLERGEWMIVPPSLDRGGAAGMSFKDSLKARTFSKGASKTNYSEEDRKAWTEVKGGSSAQSHSAKRKNEDTDNRSRNVKPRNPTEDAKLTSLVSEYNASHRSESLLESYSHSSAAAKKMKEQNEDISSRPFDRDRDLGRPTVDAKKRKEIIEKAKELNTRFGHGSSSFL